MPFLDTVISGPEAWSANETIARAIEVREGTILNVDVVEFQQRDQAYPHLLVQA